MKPEFEKIQNRPLHSFMAKTVRRPRRPSLKEAWHFHPEIEICHTIKSTGRRFVGNNIADYQQGDLVLFGSNLPHGFITEQPSVQIVIQFLDDFLGKELFSKPETGAIQELLERSKKGICFGPKAKAVASPLVISVLEAKGLPKILALLKLLDYLAHTNDFMYITEDSFRPNTKMSELERVQIIFDYILQNYQEQVQLETAAQLINMTKSSFCKFLKKHAKKTFSQIVNEIRIGHACELFMQTDKNISTVAFESGFNDVSYFSRTFKKIIHDTPRNYMERHR